ncbi:MAG: hypothetical protein IPJ46_22755 [Anaerolineales bacterium]|nr:hypothetical protein [Anaerolineales bacterium]
MKHSPPQKKISAPALTRILFKHPGTPSLRKRKKSRCGRGSRKPIKRPAACYRDARIPASIPRAQVPKQPVAIESETEGLEPSAEVEILPALEKSSSR